VAEILSIATTLISLNPVQSRMPIAECFFRYSTPEAEQIEIGKQTTLQK